MGILYIVSTPIGNLKDITIRAKEVLETVDITLCENTSTTSNLYKALNITFKSLSVYTEHNEEKTIPQIIQKLLLGQNIALVSEAGTPLISDPGFKLVRTCLENGIKVEPIPGASAVLSALVASGFPSDKFTFIGFLPKSKSKRLKLLLNLFENRKTIPATTILYESPKRITETLLEIKSVFGDIKVCLALELTKKYESVQRETISDFLKSNVVFKGEVTILF